MNDLILGARFSTEASLNTGQFWFNSLVDVQQNQSLHKLVHRSWGSSRSIPGFGMAELCPAPVFWDTVDVPKAGSFGFR